ncbi:MAG: nuclear transport factor 2 family protein [Anaerolineaceae bacterium]|nr:nuclear transport factor 2 family protein [Anaerolineaceae bacterium]
MSLFSDWLNAYGQAWETHDAERIGRLFAEDALYYINPFAAPLRGRNDVIRYWQGIALKQRDVHFQAETLSITGYTLLAHWTTTFQRVKSGKTIHLDGILLAEINPHQECIFFREWWHRQAMPFE